MQLANMTKKQLIEIIEKQKRMMAFDTKFYTNKIQELEEIIRELKAELNK